MVGSGKCDIDKKSSYCSKACQQADWKNHKPFCRRGAECSVIDDGSYDAGPLEPVGGVIQVQIAHGGAKVFVSSSTMDVKRLKEMKTIVERSGAEISPGFPEGTAIEFKYGGSLMMMFVNFGR